jgi:hypothetical protein
VVSRNAAVTETERQVVWCVMTQPFRKRDRRVSTDHGWTPVGMGQVAGVFWSDDCAARWPANVRPDERGASQAL